MLDKHRAMLADRVRMDAYASAIRAVVKRGDVVLDIGTGTGVMAFLACEAGARHVYAIDRTHMADMAMVLVRHRDLSDRVTVFHEHSTKVELPERANVLVTETLGAFGFEEQILASVIDARKRLLRPGATLIPQRVALMLAPVEWSAFYKKHIGAWSDSPLRTFASNTVYVDRIGTDARLAQAMQVVEADLATIEEPRISGEVNFTAARDGVVDGFAGWFHATLAPGVALANALPRATHWAQAFLPLERPVPVAAGTAIRVALHYEGGQEWRWRGAIASVTFDQTTLLNAPPCELTRENRTSPR